MSPSSANPLLDHIDQKYAELHPLAQAALKQGLLTGGLPAPTAVGPAQPAASPAPMAPIPGPAAARPIVPRETTAQQALIDEGNRLQTTGSGIGQIHNPLLRGLAHAGEAVGSVFFGGVPAMLTPGTQLHHQMLVNQNRAAVHAGEETENAQTKRVLEEAQAHHAEMEGKQPPHTVTTDKGIMQYNPETQRYDIPVGGAPPKEEPEGRTVTTDQGVMQWDPKTHTYAIKVGDAPEKEQAGKVVQDEKGVFHVIKNGEATPVTVGGQPFKGKAEKTGDDFEQFYSHYLTDNNLPDSAHNRLQARKMYATAGQAPEHAPQALVLDPATQTFMAARPGVHAPEGVQTMAGVNTANTPTAATRTMSEAAPKVLDLATRVGQLVDQQEKTLGPASSRWNEFMAGKVGAPNAEFTKLRTDIGLLQTLLMRMHVGARGGEQIMKHFQDLIDSGKQSPENLRAALGEIRTYAQEVAKGGKAGGGGTAGPTNDPLGIR